MSSDDAYNRPERWVGVEEVAEYLSTSRMSVYRWIEVAGLPVHYVGNRPLRRFRLSEIDAWVQSGRFNRTDSAAVDGAVVA